MDFNIQNLLQALLLSTSESLSVDSNQRVLARYHEERAEDAALIDDDCPQVPTMLSVAQVRETIDAIRAKYLEDGSVFRVIEGPEGYRFAVAPDYSEWIRLLRDQPRPLKLSPAAMETLAIIAYRQPVTRSEMETIRGVSIDRALHRLLDLELILAVGRAELPGRPIQYGTTPKFLEFTGIKSLEELPASDVVSPGQLNEWIRAAQNPEKVTDNDVGLGI